MGTRSLTTVYKDEELVLAMYRQYDGYPEGHGVELARFLHSRVMCNGLTSYDKSLANGMGCLAAQIIVRFKDEPGGIYCVSREEAMYGQEYSYNVTLIDEGLYLTCNDEFSGTPAEFLDRHDPGWRKEWDTIESEIMNSLYAQAQSSL